MVDDAEKGPEQQRRELEEVRRSFQEIGVKVGAFEPVERHGSGEDPPPSPSASSRASRLVMAWPLGLLAAVVVICLLLGGWFGYLLHSPADARVLSPATSIVTRVVVSPPETRVVPPPACLDTAQKADTLIDLFTRNVRDRRLSLALKDYTLASQACRKEASS
jgi:hypothetical protein